MVNDDQMASVPLQCTGQQLSAATVFEGPVPKLLWIQLYKKVMVPLYFDSVQKDQLYVVPCTSYVPVGIQSLVHSIAFLRTVIDGFQFLLGR